MAHNMPWICTSSSRVGPRNMLACWCVCGRRMPHGLSTLRSVRNCASLGSARVGKKGSVALVTRSCSTAAFSVTVLTSCAPPAHRAIDAREKTVTHLHHCTGPVVTGGDKT